MKSARASLLLIRDVTSYPSSARMSSPISTRASSSSTNRIRSDPVGNLVVANGIGFEFPCNLREVSGLKADPMPGVLSTVICPLRLLHNTMDDG